MSVSRRTVFGAFAGVAALGWVGATPAAAERPRGRPGDIVTVDLDGQDLDQALVAVDGALLAVSAENADPASGYIWRVGPDQSVLQRTIADLNPSAPLVQAEDGTLWMTLEVDTVGSPAPQGSNYSLVAVDAQTLAGPQLDGPPDQAYAPPFPMAAADDGRVWAVANVGQEIYLATVAPGVDPLAVDTEGLMVQLGDYFATPLVAGSGGLAWALVTSPSAPAVPRVVAASADGLVVGQTLDGDNVSHLQLVESAGRMWTVVSDTTSSRLTAVGIAPDGAVLRAPTGIGVQELVLPSEAMTVDRRGDLWFSGPDGAGTELRVARVDSEAGTVVEYDTGVSVFQRLGREGEVEVATALVPMGGGMVGAGYGPDLLRLEFVQVGPRHRVWTTGVRPFFPPAGSSTYSLVDDRRGGVWAQGLDEHGQLALVHLTPAGVRVTPTGVSPAGSKVVVGPDRRAWTQGATSEGQLVLVAVSATGELQTYETDYHPVGVDSAYPVPDGRGRLWFRASRQPLGLGLSVVGITVTNAPR